MAELVIHHDFVSPFSRVALVVARTVSATAGVDLRLAAMELWPAPLPLPTPAEVLGDDLRAALPLATQLGATMALPPLVSRTRKAHEAVVFARAHGLELVMADAVYEAVWRRGLDIGRLDVLAGLGADVGLDRDLLHVALGLDSGEAEVVAAGAAAEAAGIEGVPTFRLGAAAAVGLFPPAELLEWIRAQR